MTKYISIGLTLVAIALIIAVTIGWVQRVNNRSKLDPKRYSELEQMNEQAAKVMRSLLFPSSTDFMNSTILGKDDRQNVENWLNQNRKVINS